MRELRTHDRNHMGPRYSGLNLIGWAGPNKYSDSFWWVGLPNSIDAEAQTTLARVYSCGCSVPRMETLWVGLNFCN